MTERYAHLAPENVRGAVAHIENGRLRSGHVNENEEEGKENYSRNALKNITYMVGLEGLEPSAKGL